MLTGAQYSVERAKRLIAQLDVPESLVELDTNVYEVDEGSQTQLGLKFPTPVLSTTFGEATTPGATTQPLPFQAITRTPVSLAATTSLGASTSVNVPFSNTP